MDLLEWKQSLYVNKDKLLGFHMRLLSIDVGVVNLALCLLVDGMIQEWVVGGVPPQAADGLFPAMANRLKSLGWPQESDTVVIERQPDKNRGMKGVENFLHGWFLAHGAEVRVWDARNKIPDISGPGKAQYTRRKKASVERCRKWLEETEQTQWIEYFDCSDKKDDLADTVMQALSFVNRPQTNTTSTSEKATPKPRRPTKSQEETRYSRSNLAWIVKNRQLATTTSRFKRDLSRYYTSIDELTEEFKIIL